MFKPNLRLVHIVLAAACLSQAAIAQQSYPSKPISVVIPFASGGSVDSEARFYTDKVSSKLKQPLVFDFRAGAGSSIGIGYVIKAPNDGHTLLITNAGITVIPNFYKEVSEAATRTLVPIIQLTDRPTIVMTSLVALPNVNTLQDVVAYGKANPGVLNCNTSGAGSISHIACAALANALNIKISPVHYKGIAQGQIDLVAGRTHVYPGSMLGAIPQIKAGKLRAIAVLGPNRAALMPDVRTTHEQGFNIDYPTWLGVFAPAGTSPAIVNLLNAEFAAAVRAPDVLQQVGKLGSVPVTSSPAAFRKQFDYELAYWKKIVQDNDIKLDE